MADKLFEVFFLFADELEAQAFFEGVELPEGVTRHGMRPVDPADLPPSIFD